MSLLRAWKGVARQIGVANAGLSRMARRISDATDEAENLEQAIPSAPLILGPDGKPFGGGMGPQSQYPTGSFFGSSVAPATQPLESGKGMPNLEGTSMKLGGSKSSSGNSGGEVESGGVKSIDTNRDKIGAIVEAAGVSAPSRESWSESGTGPGEFAGYIIQTVLQLGTSAPRRFLVWCAGWLAYSLAATQKMRSSKGTPNRSRHGAPGRPRAWDRDSWFKTQFINTAPPGFTTSGGGGEAWANGLPGGGSWTGDSAFDTLTASTSKAVSEGVSKANEPMVDGINKMVDQMTKLNASLQSDGGLRYRTGGLS